MAAHRNTERGSVVIVAMMALIALISLGSLSALSVQGGMASTGHDRFRTTALYAAESGAAVAMEYLRRSIHVEHGWRGLFPLALDADNNDLCVDEPYRCVHIPTDLPGNGVRPGETGNPFGSDTRAWYEVTLIGHRHEKKALTLRVTGHGPGGTAARIEWDLRSGDKIGLGRPCPTYAQGGIDADGAGVNDCLGRIEEQPAEEFSINEAP